MGERHMPPHHLLRWVFETCETYITAETYTTAKGVLDNTPVARPDNPDSRAMAVHTTVGGGDYAQVAVDAKHKTIVEQAV
jgi:hypothetical protein